MTEKLKTQWHPAFCSAMKLELKEDGKHLDYESKYIFEGGCICVSL